MINKLKIVVTGVAGFIGSHLAKSLLEKGAYVTGVDNFQNTKYKKEPGYRMEQFINNPRFKFLKMDINQLHKSHISSSDLLINLAAQPGVRLEFKDHQNYIHSNINGFTNVCNICIDNNIPIIYASSSSVYGDITGEQSEEAILQVPKSLYAFSKIFNELYAKDAFLNGGQKSIGLRFFTVYGKMGREDMAYSIFKESILNDEEIKIFGEGKMKRDMTYIDDIITGIESSVSLIFSDAFSGYEVINLGNNNPIETLELYKLFEHLLERKGKYKFSDNFSGIEAKSTFACLKKSKRLLSYEPKTIITEGIKKIL